MLVETFYSALSANWHKSWCLNQAMVQFLIARFELKYPCNYMQLKNLLTCTSN